jgi:beta-glucosidase
MSDWTATRSSVDSVLAGMDQEMPIGLYFSEKSLTKALDEGSIDISNIDDSVGRMLTAMYTIGLFDNPPSGDPQADVTSEAHNTLAREISALSTVLLKNDEQNLPFTQVKTGSSGCIAVFGDAETVSGGGSGHVKAAYTVSPAQGIQNALTAMGVTDFSVYYNDGSDLNAAAALAQQCAYAVVNVATSSCEGSDRESLSLGDAQNSLVTTVAAANARTVVSVVAPGAVLLPWATMVKSILVAWMPGQEYGNALVSE